MEEYVKDFLGMQNENSLVLKSYRDLPEDLDACKLIETEENIYSVTFWGSFERMHGLDTILDSAIELGSEYKFYLIGDGSYFGLFTISDDHPCLGFKFRRFPFNQIPLHGGCSLRRKGIKELPSFFKNIFIEINPS